MIAALSRSLAQRSRRERLLLAVLLLVALPVAAVVLGALPLIEHRAAARAALAEAEAGRSWYVARQTAIAILPVAGAEALPSRRAPVGLGGIEARLIDAGLRDAVSRLANAQGSSITLEFESVGFEALMRWFETVEEDAGYRLSALRVEQRDGEGQVAAELRLEPVR